MRDCCIEQQCNSLQNNNNNIQSQDCLLLNLNLNLNEEKNEIMLHNYVEVKLELGAQRSVSSARFAQANH